MADIPEKLRTVEGTMADTTGVAPTLVKESSNKTTATSSTQHCATVRTSTTPPNTPNAAPQVMRLPPVLALDTPAFEYYETGQSPVRITIISMTQD